MQGDSGDGRLLVHRIIDACTRVLGRPRSGGRFVYRVPLGRGTPPGMLASCSTTQHVKRQTTPKWLQNAVITAGFAYDPGIVVGEIMAYVRMQ
jgi:hypothetical protein